VQLPPRIVGIVLMCGLTLSVWADPPRASSSCALCPACGSPRSWLGCLRCPLSWRGNICPGVHRTSRCACAMPSAAWKEVRALHCPFRTWSVIQYSYRGVASEGGPQAAPGCWASCHVLLPGPPACVRRAVLLLEAQGALPSWVSVVVAPVPSACSWLPTLSMPWPRSCARTRPALSGCGDSLCAASRCSPGCRLAREGFCGNCWSTCGYCAALQLSLVPASGSSVT